MPAFNAGLASRQLLIVALALVGASSTTPVATSAQERHAAVAAQERTPAVTARADSLSLAAVYAAVDRGNPRIRAARALARAAGSRIAGSTRPPDPTLQLGLMNYMLPELRSDPALGMRQLQVMQMLPLPGKLAAAGDAARSRTLAAELRVSEVRFTARAGAAMALIERWGAERQATIALETRRLLEDAAAVASSMYRVGDGRQVDVLRAQVEIARMDEEVIRMRTMGESALARLAAAVDLPMDSVAGPPVLPSFPDSLPSVDSLAASSIASRPMLAAGVADVEAASAELRLAARERWPDPQVGFQYGERSGVMGTDRMGSLMVGATIPLWARSRQLAMRDEATAMREMAVADLDAMRAETRGRVGETHAAIASSRRLASLYRNSVLPQAEVAAASAVAAYRAGTVDFMTVVENRMTVNRYRQELVALEVAEVGAWVELEMLLGRGILDTNAGHRAPGGAR